MKNKIALISAHASPLALAGQSQNAYVAELAKALSDSGYEVDVYTRRDSLALDEIVYFYPHVRVINVLAGPAKPIPADELLMYMDEFADMMLDIITDHQIQYSLIHAHFWLSGYVAIKIKQALGMPLVASFHALGVAGAGNRSDRMDVEDEVTWHADQLVAGSPDEARGLQEAYHADAQKVEIIPSGGMDWESIADQTAALYDRLMVPKPTSTVIKSRPMLVKSKLAEATALFQLTADTICADVADAAQALAESIKKGGKVLVCGQGSSDAGSQHFVSQLVGRFTADKRCPCAVLSLHADPALLVAWANGGGVDEAFARQIEALGHPGDVLVCFSTGRSTDALASALRQARQQQMLCVHFTGDHQGGSLSGLAHHNLVVPTADPERVSEMHLHLIHSICELVAQELASIRPPGDHQEMRREVAV